MKKYIILLLTLLLIQNYACSQPTVFSDNGFFGLQENDNVVVKAEYKKMIRLGSSAWIFQKGSHFGIMRDNGKIIVEPKYTNAERVLGQYAKFKKGRYYGLFDEMGFEILPVEFSSIDLLSAGMFVTCKNYKYGIYDFNGQMILDNIFDDIYMPERKKMILVYGGLKYEIERKDGMPLELPNRIDFSAKDTVSVTEIISTPAKAAKYYGVSATNYFLKIISAISPAYEETIDELMLSYGADTVSVLMKCAWLPKFPFVYAKKYYEYMASPNNGPLSDVKLNIKRQMQ